MDDWRKLFSLEGRVALVTGATGGLGGAFAEILAQAGAHVVLNDLQEAPTQARAEELKKRGLKTSVSAFDVTDHDVVRDAVDAIVARHGSLDVVINNAGIQNRKAFVDYSRQEWNALIETHLGGSFNVSQAAARHMMARRYGRIVMISSIAATSVKATFAPYASAKGALSALTRELAAELGRFGITCNAIAPGFLATKLTQSLVDDEAYTGWVTSRVPAGRWGLPADIAPAVLYLASDAASYVNGASLTIDGGILCAL